MVVDTETYSNRADKSPHGYRRHQLLLIHLAMETLYNTLMAPEEESRSIRWIVLHCSATKPSQDFTLEKLRYQHVTVNGWSDIGYHYYVRRDGTIHKCRPETQPGAHVRNFNRHSIGVCYEGGLDENGQPQDTRTAEQLISLHNLLSELLVRYPGAEIVGHRDLLAFRTKACPCFDARRYYRYLRR